MPVGAPRLANGPGAGSVLGASVADSLESIPRTVNTCTSWSEASDLDPGADFDDGEHSQNPTRSADVASHMRREQARSVAADVHRQVRRAIDQTGRHAASPLAAEPDTDTGALPNILETENELVHTRESLHAIISRFNSLETKSGAVGTLLDAGAHSFGIAVANVPTSMIVFTSRPLTAILTRWPMMVFLFGYAIVFLYPCIVDVRTAVRGRSISMQWLKVHEVKVYESVFPILGSEDTRLTLVDAGVYDLSLNRRLIPGCNTTLSESSFEMRCAESIQMQGIWLHVVGATTKQGSSQPHYKHAGIQFAYTIGPDASAHGIRSPGIEDIYNVMGTGQTIRGSFWEVLPSQTGLDGIYRLPAPEPAKPPLLQRGRGVIGEFCSYSVFGLLMWVACGLAVTGKTAMAKHTCVLAAAFGAFGFSVLHLFEAMDFFTREHRLACVLFGLPRGFRFDTTCGGVPSERNCLLLEKASAIILINLAYSLVWFPLAWNMWREKNFHQAFCCCVPVALFELTLFCIHERLINQPLALAALVCVSIYLVAAQSQFRLKRRLADIMRADKDFYDRWWQTLSEDPGNRRVLAQLSALVAEINKRLRSSASPSSSSSSPAAGSGAVLSRLWTRSVSLLLGLASPLVGEIRPPAMPIVRQLTCKSECEVDLTQFFAPRDVLYDNHCDVYMNYSFRPNHIKLFSRMQRAGAMDVCGAIDTLYLQATCLRPFLARKIDALLRACPNASRINGAVQAPLKTATRAVQKTLRVYGNDCSLLLDICREAMVFDELDHLHAMLLSLEQDADVKIVRIKNRLDLAYDGALSSGYRDVMINIRLETPETHALNVHHHIAELQLVPRAVYERRSAGNFAQKLISFIVTCS